MAAPTTALVGVNLVLKAGGTVVAHNITASLRLQKALDSIYSKTNAYDEAMTYGDSSWEVSFDNLYPESSAALHGAGASLKINGAGGAAMVGWRSIGMDVSVEMADITHNGSALQRAILPAKRALSVNVQGLYFDPADATSGQGPEIDRLLDNLEDTTPSTLSCVLAFGANQSFTFSAYPESFALAFPAADVATHDLTLRATGAITEVTTGADTGLAAVLNSVWPSGAPTGLTVEINETSSTPGWSKYTGSVFVSSLSVTIPRDGIIRVSGTLSGTGALTRATNP